MIILVMWGVHHQLCTTNQGINSMKRTLFTVLCIVSVLYPLSADYLFPSLKPPANKKADEVKQYICLVWDKNSHSGLDSTLYEFEKGMLPRYVGKVGGTGINPVDPGYNPLNLKEGDIGISWAVQTLAGTRKNPDNSDIHFTFNVQSGHLVERTDVDTDTAKGYRGETFLDVDSSTWTSGIEKQTVRPVCWGREQRQLNKDSSVAQPGFIEKAYKEIIAQGHEIGNNTLDYMKSNSGLPKKYFPNNGEGFDTDPNEGEMFETWETMGWFVDAGLRLSQTAWEGVISLGENELDDFLEISISNNNLFSFMAPNTIYHGYEWNYPGNENSNMFFAIKKKGYTYTLTCGLEVGSGELEKYCNKFGHNLYWPYTLDNGSEHLWALKAHWSLPPFDSLPAGLWEIPLNKIVVPEELREAVWEDAKKIFNTFPDCGETLPPLEWFKKYGTINGTDFNMYIRWGLTTENWLTIMKYNLDLRLSDNKSPFYYNCQTDIYTPMYDWRFLLTDFNESSFGLVVTENRNTWKTRIAAMEVFVDYALSKGCYFVSGIELIRDIKKMQKDEIFGHEHNYQTAEWQFYKNSNLNSTTSQENWSGAIEKATVTVDAISSSEIPACGFETTEKEGFFYDIDHIAMTYTTTGPLLLQLVVAGDKPWEVLLNNIGPEVYSGKIPLSAFHYNVDNPGVSDKINTSKITGIRIQMLTTGKKIEDVTLSLTNIKMYGVGANNIQVQNSQPGGNLTLHSITPTALRVKINTLGKYDIELLSPSGRTLVSFTDTPLTMGTVTLPLNNLSRGIYLIRIRGMQEQKTIKAIVL